MTVLISNHKRLSEYVFFQSIVKFVSFSFYFQLCVYNVNLPIPCLISALHAMFPLYTGNGKSIPEFLSGKIL